jgi:hypothetical protein
MALGAGYNVRWLHPMWLDGQGLGRLLAQRLARMVAASSPAMHPHCACCVAQVAAFGYMFARANVPADEVARGFLLPQLPRRDIPTVRSHSLSLLNCIHDVTCGRGWRGQQAYLDASRPCPAVTDGCTASCTGQPPLLPHTDHAMAEPVCAGCGLVWLPDHATQHLPALCAGGWCWCLVLLMVVLSHPVRAPA